MTVPEARILVVDDEPNMLVTLKAILQAEGYVVETAADGETAIQAICTRTYDLVLTDLKMPGIDGLGVLAEVRKSSPLTVTLMMTGHGSVSSAIEAVQLGAYEYLLKPMEVSELKQAVQRSLERKHLSEMDTLYGVSRAVAGCHDRAAVAKEIEEAARRVLGIASAQLLSFRRDGIIEPFVESTYVFGSAEVKRELQAGDIIRDSSAFDPLQEWQRAHEIRNFAVVPGISQRNLVCVLIAHNNGQPYEFHASAIRFLQSLASQSALVLSNANLFAQLQQNNLELEAANRKLRELDRLKSQFLSIATHELRTPLTIIMGYNSMLAEGLAERASPQEKELLGECITGCQRLIRLVNSMLDMSQIEAGKMSIRLVETDLNQLLRNVTSLFQAEAAKKQIQLGLKLSERLPPLELDSDRIEQVIINLVANALKFTPEGGRVNVELDYRPEAETVEISVQDTGVGICPEDQEIIFDEFAQVGKQAANRQREGSGLGLAIAKRIIEAHSGHLSLQSVPGRGSRFVCTLAARKAAPSQNSVTIMAAFRQHGT